MRTIYVDCGMGAAGDMLTAALLELVPDPEKFVERFNSLGIPNVKMQKEPMTKCGIVGTHVHIYVDGQEEDEHMHDHHDHEHDHHDHEHDHDHHHDHDHDPDHHDHDHDHDHDYHHHDHDHEHDHEHDHDHDHDHEHDHAHHHDHEHHHDHHHEHTHHHHAGMSDIEGIVSKLSVSEKVKQDVLAVYQLIAEAESHAHGRPISEIHFHEVGTMDAIADVTAVCMLMEELGPKKVVVSPIHVGSGQVKCAHGILPVPAPATAYILKDVPMYGGQIKSELCTPTGAALLKHFATSFGDMPVMQSAAIGYGMGKKEFETANCVRMIMGETKDSGDVVVELNCNVDDMTPESIAFAMEMMFEAGALEAYTIPVGMKKSRPGILFSVICKEADREKIIRQIFKHTTTIGIRENISKRYTLQRSLVKEQTKYGEVQKKISEGYDIVREKYEYDDISRIAKEQDISIADVLKNITK